MRLIQLSGVALAISRPSIYTRPTPVGSIKLLLVGATYRIWWRQLRVGDHHALGGGGVAGRA